MRYRSNYFALAGEDLSDQLAEDIVVEEGRPTRIFISPVSDSELASRLDELQNGKLAGAVRFAVEKSGTKVHGTGLDRVKYGEFQCAYPPSAYPPSDD